MKNTWNMLKLLLNCNKGWITKIVTVITKQQGWENATSKLILKEEDVNGCQNN